MSVCLKYLWIKEYGCLNNAGFQFDERYEFTYIETERCLDIKACEFEWPENFWDENGRFINIHAIVGSNGYGKTTFLRAIMAIFTQIYTPENEVKKDFAQRSYPISALMLVKDEEEKSYKMLCMGIQISAIVPDNLIDIEIINDKMHIHDILYKVKLAFFSNAFDYRDYNEPKAEHISDYSFGGLLRRDYDKQVIYQRDDRQDNLVSEQFYHSIYRQVSFMTEYYSGLCDEEQKRMFSSWPEFLHIRFVERNVKEVKSLCFYGVFEKVLDYFVAKEDRYTGGHGVSPYIYVENRLNRLLCNKQSEFDKTFDKIRYCLCRESFQNLLSIDSYKSFYQTPNYKELGEELLPIVDIIIKAIERFLSIENEHIDLPTSEIFSFYFFLQRLLEQVGKSNSSRVNIIATNYAEMFKSILFLPEKLFQYNNFERTGEFDFEIRNCKSEYAELFSEFLNLYKKIVLPFSFLSFNWGMSSGENNMLSLYAQLFAMREVEEGTNYHTKRVLNYIRKLNEVRQQNAVFDIVESDAVWILMDEADLTFHPKWQVDFISNITWFFPKILPNEHIKLQLFFTTHSPILLGDIPGQNVTYMIKEEKQIKSQRNFSKNTFGQNIYMLFQDSFFIDGPMGRFASDKMRLISEELLQIRQYIEDKYDNKSVALRCEVEIYLKKLEIIRQKMSMFGDKVVVHKWMFLADICQYKLETYIREGESEDEIEYMREEIKKIVKKKKWLEKQIDNLENK